MFSLLRCTSLKNGTHGWHVNARMVIVNRVPSVKLVSIRSYALTTLLGYYIEDFFDDAVCGYAFSFAFKV